MGFLQSLGKTNRCEVCVPTYTHTETHTENLPPNSSENKFLSLYLSHCSEYHRQI